MRIPRTILLLSTMLVAAFWFGCIAFPIFSLVGRGGFSAQGWLKLFDSETLSVVRGTLGQALISLSISVAIGFPLGIWLGAPPRIGRFSSALLALPFSVPTVVAGLVGVLWMGRTGLFSRFGVEVDLAYSFTAVVIMHVLLNAPWVARVISEARAQVPESEIEAARLLGAHFPSRLRFILWPRLASALASVSAQVFSLCVMSFALVLLLGGGPPVETLETGIFSRMRSSFLDVSEAAAFALWQLVLTMVPWVMVILWAGKVQRENSPLRVQQGNSIWKGILSWIFLTPFVGLCLTTPWSRLTPAILIGPFFLSLKIALGVVVLTLILSAAAIIVSKRWSWATVLFLLPSGISVLVLGLGFWLGYGKWIDPFEGSVGAMIALQATLFFPFVFRTLWPVSLQLKTRELEAALMLGANPVRAFFTVEWPRWKTPVAGVAAVVVAGSLGEVAAVSLFYSENLIPLPLLIQRWMGQYRFDEAHALASLLLVLSAGTLLVVRPSRPVQR